MTVGGWRPATVASVHPATAHARILTLHVPGWPGNLPGQHLDIRLTADDGYQAERSYSIATSGGEETIELGVDRVDDGEVSPYLVDVIEPGDMLEVKGPLGAYFVWDADDPAPVQLVAGGSGIVPLLAMARARVAAGTGASFRLLYTVRSPADAMYAADIAVLAEAGIAVRWRYTRAAPDDWPEPVGRLTAATLADAAWPVDAAPLVFVCGPTGFVEAAADLLVAAGHPPERVRTERFGGA